MRKSVAFSAVYDTKQHEWYFMDADESDLVKLLIASG